MIPNRKKRLAQLIARNISEVMLLEMKDPNIGLVSITDVEVAADLATAKVFISVLLNDLSAREETVGRLNRASGFIRSSIFKKMDIKRVPHLKFMLDTSIERGVRVSSLINKAIEEDRTIIKEDSISESEPAAETDSENED
ncbi:MAG: 30S ribosome-binding factor RbfA [bacterium]